MGKATQLAAIIASYSAYYGQAFADSVIDMYAEDLMDLDLEAIVGALKAIRRDPRVTRFPLPAQIRQRLAPELTEAQEAREIAARVVGAVSKYGYANTLDARAYIGEIGWRCLDLMGGWSSFCQTLSDFNITSFQAQIRELAESQIVVTKAEGTYLELKRKTEALPPSGEFRPFELGPSNQETARLSEPTNHSPLVDRILEKKKELEK